jgi:large subunit ribosomal protein L4
MPVLDVQNVNGKKISQIELADDVFSVPGKSRILHEVVTMQLSNRRAGTASVKHRSDVRGSGRKLFRQKGTGRARRGDIKAPKLLCYEAEALFSDLTGEIINIKFPKK